MICFIDIMIHLVAESSMYTVASAALTLLFHLLFLLLRHLLHLLLLAALLPVRFKRN